MLHLLEEQKGRSFERPFSCPESGKQRGGTIGMVIDESELQYGELNYERRIVAYFDVLGWRSEIEQAANDARRIARIAMVPKIFSQGVSQIAAQAPGAHLTSFSDNVIVSAPYNADRLQSSLEGLATIQLGAAFAGFWLRGGITIGPLVHNDAFVFGPALNRAHELESRLAKYPRILIDRDIEELGQVEADFIHSDSEWNFTDPFNTAFINRKARSSFDLELIARISAIANAAVPTAAPRAAAELLLGGVLQRVVAELGEASRTKDREKHIWLFNRIAPRLGIEHRAE
jgi:hypothetical protein